MLIILSRNLSGEIADEYNAICDELDEIEAVNAPIPEEQDVEMLTEEEKLEKVYYWFYYFSRTKKLKKNFYYSLRKLLHSRFLTMLKPMLAIC